MRPVKMAGILYIVATPIGNLADITLRAKTTLAAVDIIATEDTRHSKQLLNHLGITKPLLSLHNFNEKERIKKILKLLQEGKSLAYIRYIDDFSAYPLGNVWSDVGGIQSRSDPKVYAVQTSTTVVSRAILMTTDPGDVIFDPTCGSGTTACVAEQWGRRWITIDTSRVSLALARARIMAARYPYYLLADSRDGQVKEAEITNKEPSDVPTNGKVRQGFVYERVPHITLKSIANNSEIDVIWEKFQETLEPLRKKLNAALDIQWEEWEIPRADTGVAAGGDRCRRLADRRLRRMVGRHQDSARVRAR